MLARRSFIKAGLAAGVLPVFAPLANAQAAFERSRDVNQAIASAKGQAENLLAGALFSNLSLDNKDAIESANERIFNEIGAVVGGIPAEEAAVYAEPAQAILADALIERSVSVVPQMQTPVVPAAPSAGSDDLASVASDIVKAAFGVKGVEGAVFAQAATDLGLDSILARLAGPIRSGNFPVVAQFIRALLTQLAATSQTIPAIEKAAGAQAVKDILTNLSARYVLFVGWPVVVASIMFAIVQQRPRLIAAIEKAGL
jgi:hypothetical protein